MTNSLEKMKKEKNITIIFSPNITSESEIRPCIEMDKPLVAYIQMYLVMLCNDVHENVTDIW